MSPGACPLGVRRINRVLLYSPSYCKFDNLVPRVHLQKTKNTEKDDSVGYHRQPCANACHVVPTLASLVKKRILLVFSVTPLKIDQNKNQNHSTDKVQNLGNERR